MTFRKVHKRVHRTPVSRLTVQQIRALRYMEAHTCTAFPGWDARTPGGLLRRGLIAMTRSSFALTEAGRDALDLTRHVVLPE